MACINLRCFILFLFVPAALLAQPKKPSASDIQLGLKKLNTLGSVLYMAAHPDDENTRLIAYLSNEALFNTAYLSVTRGDGGQNLVGSEIREMLGVIRTQELLQARRIDGGQQFFTRAIDFGYSKSAEETLKIWDKEKILADVVWVIRKFQPEIIITRFPADGRGRHGHHTASAMLAEEAFDAAADPKRFPEQLEFVTPWQVKSLLFNTTWWFYGSQENFNSEGLIAINVGTYNHLLGKSYTEIAAESRSMHKSQGFGSSGTRGVEFEYLEHVKGEKISESFFNQPILKWEEIEGGVAVGSLLNRAYEEFNSEQPSAVVPILLEAYQRLTGLKDQYWKQVKSKQLRELLQATLGLYLEASTAEVSGTPGESIKIKLEAINRSDIPVTLKEIDLEEIETLAIGVELENNQRFEKELAIEIPVDQPYSQPYWLKSTGSLGMFEVSDPQLIGQAENSPAISIPFELEIMGQAITYQIPVVHKSTDPVKGEIFQPLAITPPLAINFHDKVQVFADETSRPLKVTLKSGRQNVSGTLMIEAPEGWSIVPEQISFELTQKGEEQEQEFTITPPIVSGEGKIRALALVEGKTYNMEQVTIRYEHIPNQLLLPEAAAKVVKLDIISRGQNIGYIMGTGDDIPNSLRQIGYTVDLLSAGQLSTENLKKYHAVILGIRALNTVDRLKYHMDNLLSYVEQGGTLIVQYNTSHRLVTDNFAPFSLKLSRDRVSVEEAPVEFLIPEHQVLNIPNKITSKDFEGWVQERGLYFPNEWDNNYQAILTTHDPGESPKQGGLLIAKYGEGYYIYSGLSWFRELPAGVAGAYRLFTNMISIGQPEPDN